MKLTDEQMNEMWDWYQARKAQQISYPLDEASVATLPVVKTKGTGSVTLTQEVAVATDPASSIDVPAAYGGTVLIEGEGVTYEVPYIRTV
jgi:hypothetical protein